MAADLIGTNIRTPGSAIASVHGGFIPSIEGMRALAVLAVLLFHLDVPYFGGGFLGVDLFFVISGFIITRNILFDLHGGKFSLGEFYVRRFRRLFPALLITVLLTLMIAATVVPPAELKETAKSAIFALFSLANVNFWLQSGYFDASAHTKPLLHTWSLSVEEQFYLFWPTLLLLCASTKRHIAITLFLLAVSLGSAYVLRDTIPDGIFYLLPFRVHQLMAGALVAILVLRLPAMPGNICLGLACVGFLILTMTVDGTDSPVLGAVAVSMLGVLLLLGRDSSLGRILLGNKFMMWIGQRSYALYLVHWPCIVLYGFFATNTQLNPAEQCLLLALSFAAAIVLHNYVEKPFRKRGIDSTFTQRKALPITASTLLVTIALATSLWWSEGLPSRIDAQIEHVVASVDREKALRRDAIRYGKCNLHKEFKFSDYDSANCANLDPARLNILIIGDSIAADTYMMLAQVYPEIHFLQATAGACTAVRDLTEIGEKYPSCQQLNEYRFSTLAVLDTDLVILASIWKQDRIQSLKETVNYLHSLGRKVLVLGPRAVFQGSVPLLVSSQPSLEAVNTNLGARIVQNPALLAEMRTALPDVEILDIGSLQCGATCDVVEGDQLLYFDALHFTRLGAQRTGERLRQSFDLTGFIGAPEPADF